jgi:hypothetical protein
MAVLTLLDPTTQQRIDLESFGPTNAAVFAGLRLAGLDTSSRLTLAITP